MDFIEFTGKTVDDALTNALVEFGVTSDQIEYEVLDPCMFYGAYTHHIIICFMHLEYKCGKELSV